MSNNEEKSRNENKKLGRRIPAVVIFVAAFYIVLGYFAFNERPKKPYSEALVSEKITETTTASMSAPTVRVTEVSEIIFPIDINTADKDSLMALDGIGPVLAERIIAYRENKPFAAKEELMNVSGIGEGIYSKISGKIFLSVEAAVTTTAKPAESKPLVTSVTTLKETAPFTVITTEEPLPETSAAITTVTAEITTTTREVTSATTVTTTEPATLPSIIEIRPVNINTATAAEFASIPGVSAKLAENLVSLRTTLGGKYTGIYELLYAEGMGEELFNRIRPYVYL